MIKINLIPIQCLAALLFAVVGCVSNDPPPAPVPSPTPAPTAKPPAIDHELIHAVEQTIDARLEQFAAAHKPVVEDRPDYTSVFLVAVVMLLLAFAYRLACVLSCNPREDAYFDALVEALDSADADNGGV